MSDYVLVKRKDLQRWHQAADDATAYVNNPAMSPSLQGECQAAALEMKHALAQPAADHARTPTPVSDHEGAAGEPQPSARKWLGPYACADQALDELRRSVAQIIGADPETWPDHGNAPLAIAAAIGLREGALKGHYAAHESPADPLDTPLPCDITVGHGTHRKGVKLRSLVTRMQVMYALAGNRQPDVLTQAALDVLAERQRQISAEGYSPDHDDEHVHGELAAAAASYALVWPAGELPLMWPWDPEHWKPRDELTNLARAGALIQAEMERLYRAKAKAGAPA